MVLTRDSTVQYHRVKRGQEGRSKVSTQAMGVPAVLLSAQAMIRGRLIEGGSVIAVPDLGAFKARSIRQAALDRDGFGPGENFNRQQDDDANAGTACVESRGVEPDSGLAGRQWHV